jgi:hypothetical protein
MRTSLAAAVIFLMGMPAFAHRLDEYLQGTIITVEKDRVQAQMTLTPGVAILPFLISSIDTDKDGVISETEQRAYAERVLHELSLGIDGHRLTPRLRSIRFPIMDEMNEGRGEIQLDFTVDLPRGGRSRKLTFENHHQSGIAAYQVNVLVPRDSDIRIAKQDRNYTQSFYRLEYEQTGVASDQQSFPSWSDFEWLVMIALLLSARPLFLWRQRHSAILKAFRLWAKSTDESSWVHRL